MCAHFKDQHMKGKIFKTLKTEKKIQKTNLGDNNSNISKTDYVEVGFKHLSVDLDCFLCCRTLDWGGWGLVAQYRVGAL